MRGVPTIDQVVKDPALFGPHFRDRESWIPWFTFNKALFGLPMNEKERAIYWECTGRQCPPTSRAKEAWLAVGRRGGKSRNLGLIATYLAAFIDWRPYLSPGEQGRIVIVAADRKQCAVIMGYIRAFLGQTALLASLIEKDNQEEIALKNGVVIEVVTCSYRTVRGRTIIAALCDEAAFWSDDTGANPASEVIASLRPAMATIPGGMLLVGSSVYRKAGPLWTTVQRSFGKDDPDILVWRAPTLTMNPSVPKSVIDRAYDDDPVSAASEFGCEFRNDLEQYISAEVVAAATAPGRFELPPMANTTYSGAADAAGGSGGGDSFTACVCHRDSKGRIIVDAIREVRPPFSPESTIEDLARFFKSYRVGRIRLDRWAGDFPSEQFRKRGISTVACDPKSDLYREFLPLLNSGRVELLDNSRCIKQLLGLERRTARGGRETIDHQPGGHDDVINAVVAAVMGAGGSAFTIENMQRAMEHIGPSKRLNHRRRRSAQNSPPIFFR